MRHTVWNRFFSKTVRWLFCFQPDMVISQITVSEIIRRNYMDLRAQLILWKSLWPPWTHRGCKPSQRLRKWWPRCSGLGDRAGAAGLSGGGGGGDAGGDRRERGGLVLRPGGAHPRQHALYHPRGGGVWDGGAGADVSGSGAGDLAFGPGRGKNTWNMLNTYKNLASIIWNYRWNGDCNFHFIGLN